VPKRSIQYKHTDYQYFVIFLYIQNKLTVHSSSCSKAVPQVDVADPDLLSRVLITWSSFVSETAAGCLAVAGRL